MDREREPSVPVPLEVAVEGEQVAEVVRLVDGQLEGRGEREEM